MSSAKHVLRCCNDVSIATQPCDSPGGSSGSITACTIDPLRKDSFIGLSDEVPEADVRPQHGPGYFVLGAMHAVLFWVSISFLTPLVVLVGLFNGRRRLLHDIVLGTVVIKPEMEGKN